MFLINLLKFFLLGFKYNLVGLMLLLNVLLVGVLLNNLVVFNECKKFVKILLLIIFLGFDVMFLLLNEFWNGVNLFNGLFYRLNFFIVICWFFLFLSGVILW